MEVTSFHLKSIQLVEDSDDQLFHRVHVLQLLLLPDHRTNSSPPQLSMGPFCVTRSNPTHQLTDPTQTNPQQVEKFGHNATRPNQYN